MSRCLEAAHYFRINIDAQCSFIHQLLVPRIHALQDEVGEGLANQCVGQIDDPLPWQTPILVFVRQVIKDVRVP